MFLFGHPLGTIIYRDFFFLFRKELPKSCNYHFIFVRQKPVGALIFFLLVLVWLGGFEVRSAWAFIFIYFFRHCRPV